MAKEISIGDEVWVHGYVDEIRRDVIIIRNEGGYFGTIADEIGYCDDYEVLSDTPQTDCETCKHNKLEWYSDECDSCSKAHSNYEPQTDCGWK